MESPKQPASFQGTMRTGLIVIAILAALTAVEWFVGTELDPNVVPLAVMSFVKAALIVWYFMHMYRAWRPGETH